ncbi:AbrB/MazE/SpoVT family DNA-binding domain-containing protein [Paenibacillus eucommiae]|uniref:AbrB family looped-hinge helix DNA binding protein n=1 Tax=Paenibacillus eucommiae TaxID=1355755 RepID=A0ABS4J8F4_9BACL|nr:AbrB/MazE/SpoVT family DNA-binding domain-containing protein [Paenibacillus eucommiae]MBP1996132.1 AbrB family looped-hinge helix DNA binding protein [Paenibacillus eucommiae]
MFDIQVNDRGQITIPKQLRDQVNIFPNDNLKIDIDEHGRLVLYKKDLIDDLEDLIKRDLINEGYAEEDFAEKILERKKELAKSLMKMVEESDEEFERGEFTSLEDLKKELNNEGRL